MARRRTASWFAVIGLLLSLLLVSTVGGAAQAACTVIASGLLNPRYVAVAADGTVYVTEAGTGGTEVLPSPPGAEGPPLTRGLTGQVTAIAPDGTKSVVARNLPSYGETGPAGIVVAGGALWVATGGPIPGGPPPPPPLPNENSLLRINPQTGMVTNVADIGAYERANNPDTFLVGSNLYGLALGADGMVYVADAGGNTLYKVNPNGGQLSVVTVIPGVQVRLEDLPPGFLPPGAPLENPERGNRPEVDPVPTGVAIGPDGIYVGNLPGAFLPGKGRVVRVSMDGQAVAEVATGLTTVVDVERGPDGMLYVSQLASAVGPPTAPDGPPDIQPGNVLRVMPNGQTQVAVPNLPFANGIAFDTAGNLYVVTNSVSFGPPGAGPGGQVMRCAGVAAQTPAPPAPQPPAPQPPMPGLPNTGAGGGQAPTALLVLFGVAAAFGAALVARQRYARD